MKQFSLVLECVITDDSSMYLVRDPRDGRVVKVLNSPEDVVSFLRECEDKVKSVNASQSHE